MRKRTKLRKKADSEQTTDQILTPREQTPLQLFFAFYTAPPP
jgi:hypothetical protein